MDQKQAVLKAHCFLDAVKEMVRIESAYLFGSYSNGTQRPESDIDIGIFVSKLDIDYLDLLTALFRKRIFIEPLIEPHLFIEGEDPSGFSEIVKNTGLKII